MHVPETDCGNIPITKLRGDITNMCGNASVTHYNQCILELVTKIYIIVYLRYSLGCLLTNLAMACNKDIQNCILLLREPIVRRNLIYGSPTILLTSIIRCRLFSFKCCTLPRISVYMPEMEIKESEGGWLQRNVTPEVTRTERPDMSDTYKTTDYAKTLAPAVATPIERPFRVASSSLFGCPVCGAETVHDTMNVYDRCLNCGWYRKRQPN